MKRLHFMLALLLAVCVSLAQAQVSMETTSGVTTAVTGGLQITLDGNWTNNGTLAPGSSTVTINGSSTQTITNAAGSFNNLTINKTGGDAQAAGNFTVDGTFTLTSGDVDLNGKVITLGTGALLAETAGNTIKGGTGYIQTTRDLDGSSSENVAGMGFEITSSADLGSTVIRRGHTQQSGNGNQSILRYFDVTPTNNSDLNATLAFHYDDSELDGQTEGSMSLYKSEDGGSAWSAEGGAVDVSANTVTQNGIASLSRWTVADAPLSIAPVVADAGADTAICAGHSAQIGGSPTAAGGTPPFTYSWSPVTGLDDAAIANPIASPATTTQYIVTVTDANNQTAKDTVLVTINPLPEVTFNPVDPLCISGAAIDLSDSVSPAGGVFSGTGISGNMFDPAAAGTGTHTITYTYTNDSGCSASATQEIVVEDAAAPVIGTIEASLEPLPVNTTVTVSAGFSDACDANDHTATIDWDDGTIIEATIDQLADTLGSSHAYDSPGVYTLTLTVSDTSGNSDTGIFEYVVIYDPNAGFVTGGGWIDSPAGAYIPDPALSGKATFGFVSRYKKGKSTPTGKTDFKFKTANLDFHSDTYDWLVVAGHRAMYMGTGSINDSGNYGFQLSAVDAELTPSTNVDLFRIRIWDKDNNDELVYDNEFNDSDSDADPTTQIGGGNIKIHSGKGKETVLTKVNGTEEQLIPDSYALKQNYPNPFNPATTIRFDLPEPGEVRLEIYNLLGQKVRSLINTTKLAGFHGIEWDGHNNAGQQVVSGVYIYRLQAGSFVKTMKMTLMK